MLLESGSGDVGGDVPTLVYLVLAYYVALLVKSHGHERSYIKSLPKVSQCLKCCDNFSLTLNFTQAILAGFLCKARYVNNCFCFEYQMNTQHYTCKPNCSALGALV